MNDQELLSHIESSPHIMAGKPVITSTRLTVETVLNQLGHGATASDLCAEYPDLHPEDIRACLLFAAKSLDDAAFMPLSLAAA